MTGAKRIVFTGKKGHGKDTAAAALGAGWVTVKFADPLKGMIRSLLQVQAVDQTMIERLVEGDLKETPSPYFNGKTSRYMQQTCGTEWGRNMVGDDFWTNIWARRSDRFSQSKTTDMRFENECTKAHQVGAFTLRIFNPRVLDNAASEHPSETAVMGLKVHADIINDSTVEALHERVLAATFEYRTT